jgi:nucleoside-diphosphate-sugar epimerase
MNAFVTGATGFIGTVLTRKLTEQGHRVRALAFPGENTDRLKELGVDVVRGDLLEKDSLRGALDGMDTVFHLAGRVTDWGTREQFYLAIYDATLNLINEATGNVKRFVYISSIAAIGLGRHMRGIRETDPAFKSGIPYNDAKLDAENLVMSHHKAGAVAFTIVRPANVTGPGSVWVRDFIEKMRSLPVPLIDHGRYDSSFIYVDNLVDGIILAGTMEIAKGKIYHLRDDWGVTWKQYVCDLGSLIGKKPLGSMPYRPARILGSLFEMVCTPLGIRPPVTRLSVDVVGRENTVDTSLARTELGWETKISYAEAMEKIGAWVRETYGRA